MRIKVLEIDGRSFEAKWLGPHDVVDLDTGAVVGSLKCDEGATLSAAQNYFRYPTRLISLFDGKYKGRFERHDECQAFADGVASVLNHMVSLPTAKATSKVA